MIFPRVSFILGRESGVMQLSETEGISFRPGQVLAGRIETVQPDGRVVVFLEGHKVEAMATVPLATGQEVFLEAMGVQEGRLYLRLLTVSGGVVLPRGEDVAFVPEMLAKAETGGVLQQFLTSSPSLMQLWESLAVSFSFPQSSLPGLSFRSLQEVFWGWWDKFFSLVSTPEEGGGSAAKQLANLLPEMLKNKYFLLCLLTLLEAETQVKKESSAWHQTRQTIEAFLKEVAGQHLFNTNVLNREELGDYLYFSCPILVASGGGEIELRIHREMLRRKRAPTLGEDIRVVLNVTTPYLGKMQFVLQVGRERKLGIRIMVEKEELVPRIEEHWPHLASGLEQIGFKAELVELTTSYIHGLHPRLDEIRERVSATNSPVLCLDIVV